MHIEYNITIFILLKRGGFYIILCVLSIIDESENKNKDIRGGFMIEFSEMRGPNKIFGSFCKMKYT